MVDTQEPSSNQKSTPLNEKEYPWGQRLYDRPFVLLFLGLAIMFVFYTIWGMFEIMSLPQGNLP